MSATELRPGASYDLHHVRELNVAPLVDVMLALLLIWMIAAPIATTSLAVLVPPLTPGTRDPTAPWSPYLSIHDDNRLTIGYDGKTERPTSMDRMASDLAAGLSAGDPLGEQVYVRADAHVRYARFVEVVDRLRRDGYRNICLIAENLR